MCAVAVRGTAGRSPPQPRDGAESPSIGNRRMEVEPLEECAVLCGGAHASHRGQPAATNTFEASPRSRAAGVTIVLSPMVIIRPALIAARTSSSQTNSAGPSGGCGVAAGDAAGPPVGWAGAGEAGGAAATRAVIVGAAAGFTVPAPQAGPAPGRYPRAERNASMRAASWGAAMPLAGGARGALGSGERDSVEGRGEGPEAAAGAGRTSYASRVMFTR
jgi:hypothetical protein